jgi:hypothetical protein
VRQKQQAAQAQQAQEAQQAQNMQAHAKTAQALSQTPVAGGQGTALDSLASAVGAGQVPSP